jgi:hypothetical protein
MISIDILSTTLHYISSQCLFVSLPSFSCRFTFVFFNHLALLRTYILCWFVLGPHRPLFVLSSHGPNLLSHFTVSNHIPENGGSMFVHCVGNHPQDHIASHSRKTSILYSVSVILLPVLCADLPTRCIPCLFYKLPIAFPDSTGPVIPISS